MLTLKTAIVFNPYYIKTITSSS